jgi:hypothetical protein
LQKIFGPEEDKVNEQFGVVYDEQEVYFGFA